MFGSLFGLVEDVVKVAVAPVSIAADVTRCVTKPVADFATEIAQDVKDSCRD
jgi:hypothetical protein